MVQMNRTYVAIFSSHEELAPDTTDANFATTENSSGAVMVKSRPQSSMS